MEEGESGEMWWGEIFLKKKKENNHIVKENISISFHVSILVDVVLFS